MINPILLNILARQVQNGLDIETIKSEEYKNAVKTELGIAS